MAFDITINKSEKDKLTRVLALYPDHNYFESNETEDKLSITFLGEDMEKDCLLQESLMEHLDEANIEENIGKE